MGKGRRKGGEREKEEWGRGEGRVGKGERMDGEEGKEGWGGSKGKEGGAREEKAMKG